MAPGSFQTIHVQSVECQALFSSIVLPVKFFFLVSKSQCRTSGGSPRGSVRGVVEPEILFHGQTQVEVAGTTGCVP